jgi:hypothetical protein
MAFLFWITFQHKLINNRSSWLALLTLYLALLSSLLHKLLDLHMALLFLASKQALYIILAHQLDQSFKLSGTLLTLIKRPICPPKRFISLTVERSRDSSR